LILLSFKFRYVDTLAVAPRIRKTKNGGWTGYFSSIR